MTHFNKETTMEPLTPCQEAAMPTLEWLIDPDWGVAGTGRSEALAHAFIRTAMKHPDKIIRVFDHHEHNHRLVRMMFEKVRRLVLLPPYATPEGENPKGVFHLHLLEMAVSYHLNK